MSINDLRRIVYKGWFIHTKPTKDNKEFLGWASKERSEDPMTAAGDVYFDFGTTRYDVV